MTPHIPQEVLALALACAEKAQAEHGHKGPTIWALESAIAAIMEVTERAIDRVMKCDFDDEGDFIVSALRNMEHLKQ